MAKEIAVLVAYKTFKVKKGKAMKQQTKEKKKLFKGERTASTIIIIAGLIGFLIAIIYNAIPIITVILGVLSAMATYEVVKAVGNESKIVYTLACTVSLFTVLTVGFKIPLPPVSMLYSFYVLLLMSLTVFINKKVTFLHSVTAFFASTALPYAFSCFIKLNNIQELKTEYTHHEGIFLVGLGFACCWITDSFAYLVGRKFGKHKMCPNISPKKSIEGAIGGIVFAAAFNILLLVAFDVLCKKLYGHDIFGQSNMKYIFFIPVSMVLSLMSMVGDLTASVLKRNFGIKDYSNILPGHGGIMDRFDSIVFVVPMLYGVMVFVRFLEMFNIHLI